MKNILSHIVCVVAVLITMIGADVKSVVAQNSVTPDPFMVKNIQVDITADSAKKARDQAFRDAQAKSLPVLFTQLGDAGYDVVALKSIDAKSIANTVRDFEISNEKISSVRYTGNFLFRYDENLLVPYMSNVYSNLPHAAAQNDLYQNAQTSSKSSNKERVLILPFFQSGGGQTSLWNGSNPWKDVWARASTSTIMAPIGDLEDIQDIQDDEPLTYNPENLARMSVRYSADRVIILFATHEGSALPASPSQPAAGLFKVNIYDTAKGRPEFIRDIILNEADYRSFGEVLHAGYNRSVEFIHGLGSVRSVGVEAVAVIDEPAPTEYSFNTDALSQTNFQAKIEYTSMQEWVMAQKALKSVPGVSRLDVLSMTPRQAEIKLSFHGGLDNVATAMTQKGYNLQETDKLGHFVIYTGRGGKYNQQGGVVYR